MKKSTIRIKRFSALLCATIFAFLPFLSCNYLEDSGNISAINDVKNVNVSSTDSTYTVTYDKIPVPVVYRPFDELTAWNGAVSFSDLLVSISSDSLSRLKLDIKLETPYTAGDTLLKKSVVSLRTDVTYSSSIVLSSVPIDMFTFFASQIDSSTGIYTGSPIGNNRLNMYNLRAYSANYMFDSYYLHSLAEWTEEYVRDNLVDTIVPMLTFICADSANSFDIRTVNLIRVRYYNARSSQIITLNGKSIRYSQITEYSFGTNNFDNNYFSIVLPTFNQSVLEDYADFGFDEQTQTYERDIAIYDTFFYTQSYEDLSQYDNGYNVGYNQGYNTGLNENNQNAYDNGYDNGYTDGSNTGYTNGYDTGYNDAIASESTFTSLMFAVVNAPVSVFTSLLDFNILGVNMSQFAISILSIALLVAVIRFIL